MRVIVKWPYLLNKISFIHEKHKIFIFCLYHFYFWATVNFPSTTYRSLQIFIISKHYWGMQYFFIILENNWCCYILPIIWKCAYRKQEEIINNIHFVWSYVFVFFSYNNWTSLHWQSFLKSLIGGSQIIYIYIINILWTV